MKIKLSTIYASPHLTAQPGSVIDVSDEEGKQLVAGRFGIVVEDTSAAPAFPEAPATAAETAAIAAPEKRSGGRGSRGRNSSAASAAPAAPAVE